MAASDDDGIIDATDAAPLEAVDGHPGQVTPIGDPTRAIVVALADQLQRVYGDDHAALQAANRTLRAALQPPAGRASDTLGQ